MKRILHIFLLTIVAVLSAAAQDSIAMPKLTHDLLEDARRDSTAAHLVTLPIGRSPMSYIDMAPAYAFHSPWALGGPAAWSLHEGFNAEVGFSVSGSFGKNRLRGAGFGEHFAAAYAMPFGKDKRWIGAFGVYADRLDWGSYHRTEVGLAGILGYSVNDWCNLYLYGAYNCVPGQDHNRFSPYALGYGYYGLGGPFDPYANLRARIGAAAEFKIGSSASITVAFEHDVYDKTPTPPFAAPTYGTPGYAPSGNEHPRKTAGQGGNWR